VKTDQEQPADGGSPRRSPFHDPIARIRSRSAASLRPLAIVAAVFAVLVAGYVVGAPGAGGQSPSTDTLGSQSQRGPAAFQPIALQPADPQAVSAGGVSNSGALSPTNDSQPGASAAPSVAVGADGQSALAATVDTTLIVKTGQLTLEVANLDSSVSQAQTKIAAIGGYIASSTRSGSEGNASSTVTYRLPVAHWDDALADLRKLASKVVSEQTDSSDVTSQAIDLDARLANLKATESALQAIMARASAIPDVLAVEQQLSGTQGEIEQLTAERNHLGNQAAMSTLSVTFTLPSQTVTTQTAQGWQLGGQVDQAVAQLVRIGQGLATIGVWALIVGLPVAFGLLVLFVAWRVGRRFAGRGRRTGATPTQA
jgi:hypothetical protein